MATKTIHHLTAHRFPTKSLPNCEKDHYLLIGEYTDSNTFNPDGTKTRFTDVFAHGTHNDVIEKTEKIIDTGMTVYRSRKRGDDYFRAGVSNALDSATVEADAPLEGVNAAIGYRSKSAVEDNDTDALAVFESIVAADRWRNSETNGDKVKFIATVTARTMNDIARINALLAVGVPLFRQFST
jgi:phosphoribosyl-AMP cyclohydrolase